MPQISVIVMFSLDGAYIFDTSLTVSGLEYVNVKEHLFNLKQITAGISELVSVTVWAYQNYSNNSFQLFLFLISPEPYADVLTVHLFVVMMYRILNVPFIVSSNESI